MLLKIVDNLIAIRIIWLLSTPFDKFDAYKLGLIDDQGRKLKKATTPEEKKATSMLHRLVWNLKRIIALAPGGSSRIGSLVAAYLLVKEGYENDYTDMQLEEAIAEKFQLYRSIRFIEEEYMIGKILEDTPTNSTGPIVSTDEPKIIKRTKLKDKFQSRRILVPM